MRRERDASMVDRRNDGLSRMPADGINLPPKRDFGTSRWGRLEG